MTIILDENLPHGLVTVLAPRYVKTTREMGYSGMKNGELLAALGGQFDILITGDKNLRYQQNLTGRRLAIVELPTNRWPLLRARTQNHCGGRWVPAFCLCGCHIRFVAIDAAVTA